MRKKNELLYKDAISACLLDCGYLTTTERYLLEKLRIADNIGDLVPPVAVFWYRRFTLSDFS